jgi:hypothetical protein
LKVNRRYDSFSPRKTNQDVVSPVFLLAPTYFYLMMIFVAWMKASGSQYHPGDSEAAARAVLIEFVIGLIFFGLITIVFVLCASLMLLGIAVSLCHAALLAAREILWRIVTYTKGPWAAICIVITTVLGVLELLVRQKDYAGIG